MLSSAVTAGHPELIGLPQWVGYRIEPGADGKPTKRPYNPRTGRLADPTDPATWGEHSAAVAAIGKYQLNGTGFVVVDEDPFTLVDFDHCRDPETGALAPWSQKMINDLDSYCEISPSGTGVHIFVRGKLPPGFRCSRKYETGKIEIYSRGRYFTMTGWHLPGTPPSIEPRRRSYRRCMRSFFLRPPNPMARRGIQPGILLTTLNCWRRSAGRTSSERLRCFGLGTLPITEATTQPQT